MTYYENIEMMRQNHPDTWDYYKIHRNRFIEEYFEDPSCFIQNTFMHAQKGKLLPNQLNGGQITQPGISNARAAHSISALLLGAMIAKHFCRGRFLSFKTEHGQRTGYEYSFAYVWTLTALYHDYGYRLEKDENLEQKFKQVRKRTDASSCTYESLKRRQKSVVGYLLNSLSIEKTPWRERDYCWMSRSTRSQQTETDKLRHQVFEEYSRRPRCIYAGTCEQPIAFPNRPEEDIIQYAVFRLTPSQNRRACIDHGIFGGYQMFDSMIKNYVDAYECQKAIDAATRFDQFIYNDKSFCFDQLTLFAYIADCIMNHNIWRQNPGTEDGEICKSLGLYYTIGTNYEKVCLVKNPLLFILAFADSLEPYKLLCEGGIDSHEYNQNELWEIFNQVDLQIRGNTFMMKVSEEKQTLLLNSLKMMSEWLAIRYQYRNGVFYISPIT